MWIEHHIRLYVFPSMNAMPGIDLLLLPMSFLEGYSTCRLPDIIAFIKAR